MALTGLEFVQAVMNRLGARTANDLAEAMKWPRGKERLVAKWLAGTNDPNYETTIALLDAAGWLNWDEIRKAQRDGALANAQETEHQAEGLARHGSHAPRKRRSEPDSKG